jgi:hypothetical protein
MIIFCSSFRPIIFLYYNIFSLLKDNASPNGFANDPRRWVHESTIVIADDQWALNIGRIPIPAPTNSAVSENKPF